MRIEEDIKLDYADVLFRPKRSTLSSRKDVELNVPTNLNTAIINGMVFLLWLLIWMVLEK